MTQVLFDNYDSYEYFDEIKQSFLEANDLEDCSDQTVYELMGEQELDEWNYCKEILENAFSDRYNNYKVLARGTAGTWRGKREAARLFDDIEQAIERITRDCDYIKIWTDNKHLYIRASHHDGTHEFELKLVTADGETYYDNWIYGNNPRIDNLDEWTILDRMWNNSKYSKLPNKIEL